VCGTERKTKNELNGLGITNWRSRWRILCQKQPRSLNLAPLAYSVRDEDN